MLARCDKGIIMADYSITAGDVVLTPDKGPKEAKTVWEVKWKISERRDEKRYVGNLWFNGDPERGAVDMDFYIEPRFRDREYTRDVIRAMVEWVFDKKDLYEINVTADIEDSDKIGVLEGSGFVFRYGNKTIEKYSIVKQRTAWTGLYIPIGFATGIVLGAAINSLVAGICICLVGAILIGAILDAKANSQRALVTGEKKTTHRKAVREIDLDKKVAGEDAEPKNTKYID